MTHTTVANKRISWIGIKTEADHTITVTFHPRYGKGREYTCPSDDSLYRILNNDQVSDICAYNEPYGLYLEVTAK